jgi:hypothetical protein
MTQPSAPPRYQYLLPAVAMMLGWGLRGFIGGGPLGAMIPGAMVVLTLCLLHPRRDFAVLAAFGAIGVGFGGEMTYGQTVGFIVRADTFWWGFLGLALKGAVWGALGGPVLVLATLPRTRIVAGASAVMIAATAAGWKFINEPKLIYFSNPLDKPRPEIWAGFLLAAAALTAFLAWQGVARLALRFAAAGFIGGFIGFGFGGAIQGLGRIFTPSLQLHWWKYMEFFFGFCFGWALAWAWNRSQDGIAPGPGDAEEAAPPAWVEIASAALAAAAIFYMEAKLPFRYGYMIAGCVALLAVSMLPWLARQIACSVTFAAVTIDLVEHWANIFKRTDTAPAYALAALASVAFACAVRHWRSSPLHLLELLMWACAADATLKFAINPSGLANLLDHVAIAFVLMAIWVSWMARRLPGLPSSARTI